MKDLRKKTAIFLPACHGQGLTFHNTHCLCAMQGQARERGFRLQIVTTPKEQNPGLLDMLKSRFPKEDIHIVPDLRDSLTKCVGGILEQCGMAVVQVQGVRNVLALRKLKKHYGSKMPVVVTTHSFRLGRGWQRYVASFVQSLAYRRYVDFTIFQSSATADLFIGSARLLKGKRAGFIPLGLEADIAVNVRSPDVPVGDPDLHSFFGQDGHCNFVYLANFSKNKGHHWILKAIEPLLRRNSNVRFVFAGEGKEKDFIGLRIRQLGLSGQIVLPGRIDRKWVPWVVLQCRAAIVGSRYETFGHNFLEPMTLGVPVIGTPTGIGKSVLMDYLTGFCIMNGDIPGFRRAVEYMISFPAEAHKMGLNAKQMVQGWTWENISASYLRLYEHLLNDCASKGLDQ